MKKSEITNECFITKHHYFKTKKEALAIVNELHKHLDYCGFIKLSSLKILLREDPEFEDEHYGWVVPADIEIVKKEHGYVIGMVQFEDLNDYKPYLK